MVRKGDVKCYGDEVGRYSSRKVFGSEVVGGGGVDERRQGPLNLGRFV